MRRGDEECKARLLLDSFEPQCTYENKHVKNTTEDNENAARKQKSLFPQGWEAARDNNFFVTDLRGAQTDAGGDAAEGDEKRGQGKQNAVHTVEAGRESNEEPACEDTHERGERWKIVADKRGCTDKFQDVEHDAGCGEGRAHDGMPA